MIVRPNRENVAATSRVTNPVTHTALTEVNNASIYEISAASLWENGRYRSTDPMRMMMAKPKSRYLLGGIRFVMVR